MEIKEAMSLREVVPYLKGRFPSLKVNRSRACSDSVSICYRYSKLYPEEQVWWTGEEPERLKTCDYLVLALQYKGLFVVPTHKILEYWEKLDVRPLANGRRNIRIKEVDGDVVLYNKINQGYYSISEYFHYED